MFRQVILRGGLLLTLLPVIPTVAQIVASHPSPTPTAICPRGDGHPLLCMGGAQQGKRCMTDGDCAGGGECNRHGHPRTCPEQCLGTDPGYRCPGQSFSPFPLGGLKGDISGDRVVGYCSTESNRNYSGHPAGIMWGGFLAYDAVSSPSRLWLSERGGSSTKAWEGAAIMATDAPATLVLGQTNFYQHDWWRTGGDCTINCNVVAYSFDQDGGVFTSTGPAGEVWIGDQVWARKYNAPVTQNGAAPDFLLCSKADHSYPSEAMRCMPKHIAVSAAGRIAIVDAGSRIMLWNTPPTMEGQAADVALGVANPGTQPSCNLGGVSASSLCNPTSAAFTGRGDLVVSDTGNHRLLIFTPCNLPRAGDFCDHQNATVVLCQPDLVTNTSGIAADKCDEPMQVATAGVAVAVADSNNNRVLLWNDPTVHRAPDTLIGQATFTTRAAGLSARDIEHPVGVAIGGGNLYVSFDHPHYRILRFAYPVVANKPAALSVLGQPDFTSGFRGKVSSLSGLFDSASIAFNARGGVYISADSHRVMYWANKLDASRGLPAGFILGQDGGPNDRRPNRGDAVSARGFDSPSSVAVAANGDLYVADSNNHRILVFKDPTVNDDAADRVFGQAGEFTTGAQNAGGAVTAAKLAAPRGMHIDAEGTLWVADLQNHRVLAFCQKTGALGGLCTSTNSHDESADLVLGQVDFSSNSNVGCSAPTASTLCYPYGVFHDVARRRLFVVDVGPGEGGFGRVLVYPGTVTVAGTAASAALGAPNLTSFGTCSEPKASSMCLARSIVAHPSSGHLYVLESPGMVEYGTLETGAAATRCFGMLDCTQRQSGTGYVTCAWSTSVGQLGIDAADNEIWVPGAGEGAAGIMVVLDPEAPTPTSSPTVTPTKTASNASVQS